MKYIGRKISVLVSAALMIYIGTAAAADQYVYTPIDFPGVSGNTQAFGINNRGHIVGSYTDKDNKTHGFFYDGEKYTTIDFPGADGLRALGVNNSSQIVGVIYNATSSPHGFFLNEGVFGVIDFPGAIWTQAFSLNDRGEVVGNYVGLHDGEYRERGYLLSKGTFTTVFFPSGSLDKVGAMGINNWGDIAGTYSDLRGFHGFLQHEGASIPIDVPGAMSTGASGVNNLERVVGVYDGGGRTGGYLWNGRMKGVNVDFPGAGSTYPQGINDRFQIVGFYTDATGIHGFLAVPVRCSEDVCMEQVAAPGEIEE